MPDPINWTTRPEPTARRLECAIRRGVRAVAYSSDDGRHVLVTVTRDHTRDVVGVTLTDWVPVEDRDRTTAALLALLDTIPSELPVPA